MGHVWLELPPTRLCRGLRCTDQALVDALGGSERIAGTPMPRGPHAMLRVFSAVWIFTFPLAISDE